MRDFFMSKIKQNKNIFLGKILEAKSAEVEYLKKNKPIDFEIELKNNKLESNKNINFFKDAITKNKINIISEIKKASPSKGDLNINLDVEDLATIYETNGASAISVLTEKDFFKGKDEYLIKVKNKVKIPVLRKDFIVDIYQIFESKIIGSDAILLIADILEENILKEFFLTAKLLNLGVLMEIHDEENLAKALNVGADIIGINNRCLKDFSVDIKNTETLSHIIPNDKVVVSESGINSREDIDFLLKNSKAKTFLIGETFVKSKNPGLKLREFLK